MSSYFDVAALTGGTGIFGRSASEFGEMAPIMRTMVSGDPIESAREESQLLQSGLHARSIRQNSKESYCMMEME